MSFPVATRWFERRRVSDDITLFWEPHVVPLMRCNIWHVRGRDRDLVVDTGMGVVSLVDEMQDLLDKPVTAVATHGHGDHIGSHHEFEDVLVHPAEARALENPPMETLDPLVAWGESELDGLRRAGYEMTERYFVTALPPGVTIEGFRQAPAKVTRLIEEGEMVDIGNRHFEVLHPQRILDAAPTVIQVVPLTSTLRGFHSEVVIEADPANGLEGPSVAQCQHVRAVSPARVASTFGNVGPPTLSQIRETIAVIIDLP